MTTRLAVFQGPGSTEGFDDTIAAITRAADRAADLGASILVTPEMSVTGYNIGPRAHELAEAADGPIGDRLSAVASRTGVAISYGFPERVAGGVYNSTRVVGRHGEELAVYRKCHLYGDLDRGLFLPGDRGVVQFGFDGLTVGLLTCYDVEFPEAVRAHALAGTDLLLVPTGLMAPFDFVSRILVPARAYESQVFIAYANRCDVEGELDYCGASCVIAPDISELARAGAGEELLLADISLDLLTASRAVNTHLADRRTDLYAAPDAEHPR